MSVPKEDFQKLAVDLQATVDAVQEKFATKIAADEATIAQLQAIIDARGTDAELQAIFDSLVASKDDLAATFPTEEPPVDPSGRVRR